MKSSKSCIPSDRFSPTIDPMALALLKLYSLNVGNKTKLNWFLKSFASQIYLPDSLIFGIK